MGLYIDTGNNETWIQEYGIKIDETAGIEPDSLKVCVVDNIAFKAYLVLYSEQEERYIRDNRDDRPKQWYVCKKEDLKTVCPQWSEYV